MKNNLCTIKQLGLLPYVDTWNAMKSFTDNRTDNTPDELWIVEHPPIFTLGQAGKMSHLIKKTDIPVLHVDRGGQITYHGPGQCVVYCLINLKHKDFGVRKLVTLLEQSVIDLLSTYGIEASAKPDAPGVYVNESKICSIGLRIRRGCSFHGLALNVNMDLTPFEFINTCGYPDLSVTQVVNYDPELTLSQVSTDLIPHLTQHLRYTSIHTQ